MDLQLIKSPEDLTKLWKTLKNKKITKFYSDKDGNDFAEFSNFYRHESFEFVIPKHLQKEGYSSKINCEFSEKAIMLCKAILFDDHPRFVLIENCDTPAQAKKLGRQVENFDQLIWDENVLEIAYQVVSQKFSKVKDFKNILLSTKDSIIAESTSRDLNWGTGCDLESKNSNKPQKWVGKNILGWALMKTRIEFFQDLEQVKLSDNILLPFDDFDPFKDAGSREIREKIHIRYKARNTRKSWTLVEGLDGKNANNLSKIWKKKFSCASDVIIEDEILVVKLQGDHRVNIKKNLIENDIVSECDIILHGPGF